MDPSSDYLRALRDSCGKDADPPGGHAYEQGTGTRGGSATLHGTLGQAAGRA